MTIIAPFRLLAVALALVALGLGGVGLLSLLAGDFAFTWQPVPQSLPARALLARGFGLALLVPAGALLIGRTRAEALAGLAVLTAAWTALMHVPVVLLAPARVAAWLGVAEIGGIAAALWAVVLDRRPGSAPGLVDLLTRAFGAAAIVFGTAHFVYPAVTAGLVPGWLPAPLFWVYATGAAHLVGGIALLLLVQPALAATLLGAMYLSWVIVLHAPRVIENPGSRLEWTMMFIAAAIAGAAWLIATVQVRPRPRDLG